MRCPKWITAQQLDSWAPTPQAKVTLPNLIRRLVLATVPPEHLQKVDFPAGAETQRPGYDGTTVTDERTPFVPNGVTFWELGCVVGNPKGKAQGDYDTRIQEHRERVLRGETEDLKGAAFIAVTPVDWQKAKEWEAERNHDGHFGEVRAYDSNTLEHWIETAPPVGLWLAHEMGRKIDGAVDIGSHWANVQATLRQPLPAKVLLVNREAIAAAFDKWVDVDGGQLAVKAPSAAELVAVFCAWVQMLPSEKQDAVSSRTVIVESRETWRELATSQHPLILVAAPRLDGDADLFAEAVRQGHQVLRFADFRAGRKEATELPMMRRFDLQHALEEAGLLEGEAYRLAETSGGNFTILRRRFARSADAAPWAQDSILASLLLVPAWQEDFAGDTAIVSRVAGKNYSEIQEVLLKRRAEPDAPVRRVLETWEFLSPVDAWEALHPLLTRSHLDRFQQAATEVLCEDDPALDLPPDERFMAAIKGKVRQFSNPLRRAIAEILALGATREEGNVGAELGFAARAASIVSKVLPPGCSWRRWASLDGLLPLLMEAAPDEVMKAIEKDLASSTPQLGELLKQETPGAVTGRIYHSGTLWALETAAWSAAQLQRVSLALARWQKVDVGESRWVNRPSESLVSLFFSWRPQTVASLGERVAALGYLRRKEPQETWKLVSQLLPKTHEAISDNPRPTYRDWAAGWTGMLEKSDIIEFIGDITDMGVEMAGEEVARWPALIEHIGNLRGEHFQRVMSGLETLAPQSIPEELKKAVWSKLREIVQHHGRFRRANWALPEPELDRLALLRDKFSPTDVLTAIAPLFNDDGWADGSAAEPFEQKIARRNAERRPAIRRIWETGSMGSILSLVRQVRQPWSVGWALAEELGSEAEGQVIPGYLASEEDAVWRFAAAFAHHQIQARGVEWAEARPSRDWAAPQVAAWAMQMPFVPRTWDWVNAQGQTVSRFYWERTATFGRVGLELATRSRAALELQSVGRSWSALELLMMAKYEKRPLTAEVVCKALEAIIATPEERQPGAMDAHYIHEAFEFLQGQEGVDEGRVAKLEFSFLPFLDGHPVLPLTLQRELSRVPESFIDCLKLLYKPHNRPTEHDEKQPDPETAAKAGRIWHLLKDWCVIPGTDTDGKISPEALRSWVAAARQKAREADRLEVCDLTLGELFAKSPVDDDKGLPAVAIREVIEECESEKLENGLAIGLRNLRGCFSKALHEGGKQERELAETFERYATICARWPRTATVLRHVARSYVEEAEREDERAKLQD